MAIFLDSARLEDARKVQTLGFVDGITTNPKRMRETGRPALEVLEELVEIFDGHVFYQLTAQTLEARIDEAWHAYDLRPDRVVIKLPATTENLSFLKRVPEIEVAITMIFSPLQSYAAAAAKATYVVPYVDSIKRHVGEYTPLIREINESLMNYPTEIIAGDIRTTEQALQALKSGANHITVPMDILMAIGNHDLTQRTLEELSES